MKEKRASKLSYVSIITKTAEKTEKKRSDLRHELNRVFDLAYIYIMVYTTQYNIQAEERGTIYLI